MAKQTPVNNVSSVLIPELEKLLESQSVANYRLLYQYYTRYGPDGFQKVTEPALHQLADTEHINKVLQRMHQQQQVHLQRLTIDGIAKKLTPYKGLVPGFGEPSVYDTGLRLDPVFGFPYIPASSWQGVIRSWFIQQYFEADEEQALANEGFLHLFGSETLAGSILFLDAYPLVLTTNSIQPEIMTPHFSKYYTQQKAPADTEIPVPITYLVVKNASFVFRFGYRHTQRPNPGRFTQPPFEGLTPIQVIENELPNIFRFYGVGARTKNGFGRGDLTAYSPTNV